MTLLILICSLPAYSQFWVEFRWNDSNCNECIWMKQALRLTPKQAKEYHKIIHKYGKKIEKEARRDYKHWDKASRRIYDYRMDRDYKIQKLLSPNQFSMYVRLTRERPQRIHDYRGWYENPHYAGRRISPDWRNYDNNYWNYRWDNNPQYNNRPPVPNNNRPQAPNNNRNNNSNNSNRNGRR